ncbi:MAG: putative acyl-CoA thioester hydrolase [Myxococcota bacterium]|nr:putative acyl-CoA thioester hydrolase [Myxococcota bacterium]
MTPELEREIGQFGSPVIRTVMMPKDTNAHGTIFGGVILSYVDVAGAEAAYHTVKRLLVTKVMREVVFVAPVYVGDLVSFYGRIIHIGRTSVTTKVMVVAERGVDRNNVVKVTEAEIVYVAVNDKFQPVPINPE